MRQNLLELRLCLLILSCGWLSLEIIRNFRSSIFYIRPSSGYSIAVNILCTETRGNLKGFKKKKKKKRIEKSDRMNTVCIILYPFIRVFYAMIFSNLDVFFTIQIRFAQHGEPRITAKRGFMPLKCEWFADTQGAMPWLFKQDGLGHTLCRYVNCISENCQWMREKEEAKSLFFFFFFFLLVCVSVFVESNNKLHYNLHSFQLYDSRRWCILLRKEIHQCRPSQPIWRRAETQVPAGCSGSRISTKPSTTSTCAGTNRWPESEEGESLATDTPRWYWFAQYRGTTRPCGHSAWAIHGSGKGVGKREIWGRGAIPTS